MVKTSKKINGEKMFDKITGTLEEIISKTEELIKEGNLRRIVIKDQEGEVFMEIPVVVGAIITVAAPIVTAISSIAGFAANFSIEIIKKDNSKVLLLCEKNPSQDN